MAAGGICGLCRRHVKGRIWVWHWVCFVSDSRCRAGANPRLGPYAAPSDHHGFLSPQTLLEAMGWPLNPGAYDWVCLWLYRWDLTVQNHLS